VSDEHRWFVQRHLLLQDRRDDMRLAAAFGRRSVVFAKWSAQNQDRTTSNRLLANTRCWLGDWRRSAVGKINLDDCFRTLSSNKCAAQPDPNQSDSDSDCSPDSRHASEQLLRGNMI